MPLKHNLTKYDRLREEIRVLSMKDSAEYDSQDRLIHNIAVLIASFSSARSWKTCRELENNGSAQFNTPEIHREYLEAKERKWKEIAVSDITEVSQRGLQESKFERWLYYNVEGSQHGEYKRAWAEFDRMIEYGEEFEEQNATA